MSDSAVRRRAPHPVFAAIAVILLLLAAAVLLVRQVPVNGLRARLEADFTRATGRTLRIDGPLRLTLLPAPGLVADDVSISNGPGGSRPLMVRARTVGVAVALAPLLGGELRITSLTLTDPVILLERLPDGTPNWRFAPPRTARSPAGTTGHPHHRFDLSVETIEATGGELAWHDRGGFGTGAVSLTDLRGNLPRNDAPATFYATGRHGTAPFHLSLSAGRSTAPADIGPARTRRPFRAVLDVGGGPAAATIAVDGALLDGPKGRTFDGRVDARVPDLASLDALFPHAKLPPATDLDFHAAVATGPAGREIVRALTLSGRDLAVDRGGRSLRLARFALGAAAPDAPIRVDAAGMVDGAPLRLAGTAAGDLDLWSGADVSAPLDTTVSLGPNGLALRGTLTRTGARTGRIDATAATLALPDPDRIAALWGRPAPFRRALAVSGPTTITVGERGRYALAVDARAWRLDGRAMPPVAAAAMLDPATIDARLALAPGTPPFLAWHGARAPADTAAPATLTMDGHGLPAGAIAWAFAHENGLGGRLDVTARLAGEAKGFALDGATLTGPLDATLLGGTLDRALAHRLLGSVLATAHLPVPAFGAVPVRCAAVNGRFTDGVYAASALSLDTPNLVLNGSGTADLRRDRLAIALHPTIRLGAVGVATDLALAGPLDDPGVSLVPGAGHRFALALGPADASAGCDALPGVGPVPRPKTPRAADILRGLGLLR